MMHLKYTYISGFSGNSVKSVRIGPNNGATTRGPPIGVVIPHFRKAQTQGLLVWKLSLIQTCSCHPSLCFHKLDASQPGTTDTCESMLVMRLGWRKWIPKLPCASRGLNNRYKFRLLSCAKLVHDLAVMHGVQSCYAVLDRCLFWWAGFLPPYYWLVFSTRVVFPGVDVRSYTLSASYPIRKYQISSLAWQTL